MDHALLACIECTHVTGEYTDDHRRMISLIGRRNVPGNLQKIEALLKKMAKPFMADRDGISPLAWACFYQRPDVVALLLQHGHPPNFADKRGIAPLHLAAQKDQCECIQLLLKAGANMNQCTSEGDSPLHFACDHLATKAVLLLLYLGADRLLKNQAGLLPIAMSRNVNVLNIRRRSIIETYFSNLEHQQQTLYSLLIHLIDEF